MKTFQSALSAVALACAVGILAVPAQAARFDVKMLNKGDKGMMVFQPDLVRAAPGDTIHFIPVDAGHNVENIKGMIPDGADTFKSKPSQEFSLTLTKEGVYGIRCTPHYGLGMVGLIVVGQPTNLEQAKAVKTPPKAHERLEPLFKEISQ